MCLAIGGELIAIDHHSDPLWRMGEVRFGDAAVGGVLQRVSLACVPEARLGDRLLVHVGLAITVLAKDPEAEL